MRVTLDDPRKLSDFQETMEKSGSLTLLEDPTDKTSGDCLAVVDELFIKTKLNGCSGTHIIDLFCTLIGQIQKFLYG